MGRLVNRILLVGIEPEDDFESRITTRITNVTAIMMFLVALVFSLVGTYLTQQTFFFVFSILISIAYLMAFLANVGRYHTAARFMLLLTGCLHYGAVCVSVGALSGVEFYVVILAIVPIFLFSKRERRAIAAAFTIIAVTLAVVMVALARFEPLVQVDPVNRQIGYYVTMLCLTVLVIVIFYNLYFVSVQNYRDLRDAKSKSDRLIYDMLPDMIAERLLKGDSVIADSHGDAAVLFADIVDFSRLARRLAPRHLVELLNEIFSAFDRVAERRGIEKIKTIGDGYMAATGVLTDGVSSADAMVAMAKDMLRVVAEKSRLYGFEINIRIGISSGQVISGVIGDKKKTFDLWGNTVNLASRLEASGLAGGIQITESTYWRLEDREGFRRVDDVEVRGIGRINVYTYDPQPIPLATPA